MPTKAESIRIQYNIASVEIRRGIFQDRLGSMSNTCLCNHSRRVATSLENEM